MRLRRLDLLRYGRFTDLTLALPQAPPADRAAGHPDLHILFGPNEAGKSTALAALEDLLFGIPARSPLNFLHDYPAMRLGAELEDRDTRLALRRRKGNRDTLLDAADAPLPGGEAALAALLQGADRGFFERMFSLDHRRLRAGGREILEAKDEVGQMLFAAGAGMAGLRDRLAALRTEADGLWGPRKSARRAYAQAEDRLKAAETALREQTVTAGDWQKLQKAEAEATAAYAALETQIQAVGAEQARLIRIRRVHGEVRRKAELDARLAALGPAPPLPADAGARLAAALRDEAKAAARIEPALDRLEAAQTAHDGLHLQPELLERAADIRQLQERRIEVRAERASLPRRRQELADAEARLQRLAAELDWPALPAEALPARIPSRPKLAALRALLTRRGSLAAAREAAAEAATEAADRQAALDAALAAAEVPAGTDLLAAQIRAIRDGGDPAARIAAAEAQIDLAAAAVAQGLAALAPPVADAAGLAALPVPPRQAVLDWRDRRQDLERRQRENAEGQRAGAAALARHRKAEARILQTEHAVAPQDLTRARTERDARWQGIRNRLGTGEALPEDELDGYQDRVADSDALADRRFETAEAAARLAVTARQAAEQAEALDSLATERDALAGEGAALDAGWQALCDGLPGAFLAQADALQAGRLLDWLEARAALLEREAARAAAMPELAALRRDEAAARDRLTASLAACGAPVAALAGQPLRTVLEAAAACLQRHEKAAEARARQQAALRDAAAERGRRDTALAAAEAAWAAWLADWRTAATAAGLPDGDSPAAVEAQVNALDEMREIAGPAETLRQDRIAKIERDIAAYAADTAALLDAIAPDLSATDADAAVLELVRRLAAAEDVQVRRAETAKEIAEAQQRHGDSQAARQAAQEAIDELQRLAGVADTAALQAAIDRSEALRAAQADHALVLQALRTSGDDLPVATLEAECAGIDIDAAAARESALQAELAALNEGLLQAREARAASRGAFDAIGGTDGAARAAADREAALAEMQDVAERYTRAKSAALLLDWAIDRYRQEKQAPLLRRASAHFAMLTGGSFSELALEFDEADNLHLTGRRPDGARVGIDGMSDGTADQLYLALRVAAVEDYLARAAPLPFIADDLFVNFDDTRAEAGFRVLGALAMQTQVLVFTHHRHLVDVARAALGPELHCLSLADGSAI